MQLNISSFSIKKYTSGWLYKERISVIDFYYLSHIFILLTKTAADGSTIKSSYHFVLGLSLLL